MSRVMRGLVAIPALCLALSSCSTWTSAPPVGGVAEPAPEAKADPTRRVLQAEIANRIPVTTRCYTLTTERVIFRVIWVESDNKADWDARALAVPRTCDRTYVWDDKWYWYRLSTANDPPRNLMLMWKNIDSGEWGYMVVKNTPSVWIIYSNSGHVKVLKNNETYKLKYTTNGREIHLDVKNPNNTDDWTANDIWVSFGY